MDREQVLQTLNAKLQQFADRGRDQDEEWVQSLITKFETVPVEEFVNCDGFADIRVIIESYKAPSSRKPRKPTATTTTYSALASPVWDSTEKAFAIIVGTNGMHGSNYRDFKEWIPYSQVVKQDGKIYVPNWLINKNKIWKFFDKNDSLVK